MRKHVKIILGIIFVLLLVGCKNDTKDQKWLDDIASSITIDSTLNEVASDFEVPIKTNEDDLDITWESKNTEALTFESIDSKYMAKVVQSTSSIDLEIVASIEYEKLTATKTFNVTIVAKVEDSNMRKLTIKATIPNALPENSYLSIGSNINSWQPSDVDYKAKKISDTQYQLDLEFDISEGLVTIQYKWTIQVEGASASDQWKQVEKGEDGVSEIDNRLITISGSSPAVTTVEDTVLAFADPNYVQPPTVVGNLDIITDFEMPQFTDGRTRTIRVWTPSNYNKDDKTKHYAVIYMQDGQNVFDTKTSFAGEWEVDETIEKMILENNVDGFIVVGIDNSSKRMEEYTPNWQDQTDAEGGLYAQFIVETLKP